MLSWNRSHPFHFVLDFSVTCCSFADSADCLSFNRFSRTLSCSSDPSSCACLHSCLRNSLPCWSCRGTCGTRSAHLHSSWADELLMFVFEAPTFWFCLSTPRNFLQFVENLSVSSAFQGGSLKSSLITRLWETLHFKHVFKIRERSRSSRQGENPTQR